MKTTNNPLHNLIIISTDMWNCKKALSNNRSKSEIKNIEKGINKLKALIPALENEVKLLKEIYER